MNGFGCIAPLNEVYKLYKMSFFSDLILLRERGQSVYLGLFPFKYFNSRGPRLPFRGYKGTKQLMYTLLHCIESKKRICLSSCLFPRIMIPLHEV